MAQKDNFVSPLVGLTVYLAFMLYVVIDEVLGPVRYIDGQPDDAPRMAAGLLIFVSPIYFGLLLLAHYIAGVLAGVFRVQRYIVWLCFFGLSFVLLIKSTDSIEMVAGVCALMLGPVILSSFFRRVKIIITDAPHSKAERS